MKIEIDSVTAEAILKIDDRYFFDLFKEIRVNEDEEFEFRDAISAIAQKIKNEKEGVKE